MNFSLFEVNLVILIIALLFTVSLKSVRLYHNANLQTYILELAMVKKDIKEFYDFHDYYPGDFPLATMIWNDVCVNFNNGQILCNGNGDSKISDQDEGYLAWSHLNKFRRQLFTIQNQIPKTRAIIGINVKNTKSFNDVGMQILGDTKLNNNFFQLKDYAQNFLRIAAERKSGNLLNSAFAPKDLYFIDNKIDDGFPLRGRSYADSGNDAEADCLINNESFNLSETAKLCYQQVALD